MALATAAISIADFVPSTKELNIWALTSPPATSSSVKPKCSHTVSGVDWWYAGRYFVPLPAQTTSKPQARAQSTSSQIRAGWSP